METRREVVDPPTRAYGGGAFAWVGPDRLVVAAADGRLVLLEGDGAHRRVLSAEGRAAAPGGAADAGLGGVRPRRRRPLRRRHRRARRRHPRDAASSSADYAWDPACSPDGRLVGLARVGPAEHALGRVADRRRRPRRRAPLIVAGGDHEAVGQPRSVARRPSARLRHGPRRLVERVDRRTGRPRRPPGAARGLRAGRAAVGSGAAVLRLVARRRGGPLVRNEAGFGRLVAVGPDGVTARAAGWHHGLDWGPAGIAAVRSGARTPSTVTVLDAAGRRLVARGPVGGFEAVGLEEPEAVTWPGADGTPVPGLLWRPTRPPSGPGTLRRCSSTCTAARPGRRPWRGARPARSSPAAAGRSSPPTRPDRRATAARTRRRSRGSGARRDVEDVAAGIRVPGGARLVRPRPRRGERRQRGRVDRAARVRPTSRPRVRGDQPVRRHGPRGPGRDDAPLRVPLPRPARRRAAPRRRPLPGAFTGDARRGAARPAARAARPRRPRRCPSSRPTRSSPRFAPPAGRSTRTSTTARDTAGRVPPPSRTSTGASTRSCETTSSTSERAGSPRGRPRAPTRRRPGRCSSRTGPARTVARRPSSRSPTPWRARASRRCASTTRTGRRAAGLPTGPRRSPPPPATPPPSWPARPGWPRSGSSSAAARWAGGSRRSSPPTPTTPSRRSASCCSATRCTPRGAPTVAATPTSGR